MKQKWVSRAIGALVVTAGLLSLAGCSGAGATLPAGEAYLTIHNPNDPALGSFTYENIMIDNVAQSILPISAGSSQEIAVTIAQHQVDLEFVQQPSGQQTPTTTPWSDALVNVPQGGITIDGPTYPPAP